MSQAGVTVRDCRGSAGGAERDDTMKSVSAVGGGSTVELAAGVLTHKDDLLAILTQVATYEAALDEIHRCVRVLAGARWEALRNAPRRVRGISVFLPSNNILYSYVLSGIIPSLYCDSIVIRPSARTAKVAREVHDVLAGVTGTTCDISLTGQTQRRFVESCGESEAVLFNGQYENGLDIMSTLGASGPSFLAFGSGPNPVVAGPEAAVDSVGTSILNSRLYNSGQDCLCPDIIFVHRSILDRLLVFLCDQLSAIPVMDRRDPGARVARLVYPDAVEQAAGFIKENQGDIAFGGLVRPEESLIGPTVIVAPFRAGFHPPELFSPVFHLAVYDDGKQVRGWLDSARERLSGMYASVYGEPQFAEDTVVGTSVIVHEATTFDIEDGNQPFGGFGVQASSVRHRGHVVGRPLLLSRDVRRIPGAST
jgi:acyl-CoA reductase-like NAD-dependent aldehyde dehydrogenase